ncbi:uncharacterized protein LOC135079504 [Ostrinia nubilalis]|uniref:uncharacterized protein LOC135079504 n=1 Tax=Ostrinia nubilalis TaxID=29057 RepID=UPI0030822FCF
MVMYVAPIWADALNKRENAALLRRLQRAIAQKVARTYRTEGRHDSCAVWLPHSGRQWLERPHGFLTFRLAQVLTDGCFGSYLHRIGREESPLYHKCGAADDTVQHTLAVYTSWEEQRRVLTAVVGRDLSLPSLVNAMLGSEGCWMVVAFFCEEIILQKEVAERER